MPASRSRTERWRECLRQVHEREGALEVSIDRTPGATARGVPAGRGGDQCPPADLLWRVRILDLADDRITIEQPSAAGRSMDLQPGIRLLAAMAIGQNRWMFHTHVLRAAERPAGVPGGSHATGFRATGGLRPRQGLPASAPARPSPRTVSLAMPDTVERCQRRNFYRISTAELNLPRVECWPILDPTSVIPAEIANRTHILDLASDLTASPSHRLTVSSPDALLPEVGPRFTARLMNLGGGGVGLIFDPREAAAAERARLLWLKIDLTPHIPAPIAMTARPVHSHLDSAQNLYTGLAFEWTFHPAHREFVVDQITRYVQTLQRAQFAGALKSEL